MEKYKIYIAILQEHRSVKIQPLEKNSRYCINIIYALFVRIPPLSKSLRFTKKMPTRFSANRLQAGVTEIPLMMLAPLSSVEPTAPGERALTS